MNRIARPARAAIRLLRALGLAALLPGSALARTQPAQYDHVALEIPADWDSTMDDHQLWSIAPDHDLSGSHCSVMVSPLGRGSGDVLKDLERFRQVAIPANLVREQPVVRALAGGWSVAFARYCQPYFATKVHLLLVFARQSGDIQVVAIIDEHPACSAQADAVLRSIRVGESRARIDPHGLAQALPRPKPAQPAVARGAVAGRWDGLVRIGPYLSHQILTLDADGRYTLVERSTGKTLYAGAWRMERDRVLLVDANTGRLAVAFTLVDGTLKSDQQDVFTKIR